MVKALVVSDLLGILLSTPVVMIVAVTATGIVEAGERLNIVIDFD